MVNNSISWLGDLIVSQLDTLLFFSVHHSQEVTYQSKYSTALLIWLHNSVTFILVITTWLYSLSDFVPPVQWKSQVSMPDISHISMFGSHRKWLRMTCRCSSVVVLVTYSVISIFTRVFAKSSAQFRLYNWDWQGFTILIYIFVAEWQFRFSIRYGKYKFQEPCFVLGWHFNFYRPARPHAGLKNELSNVLACHILACVCSLHSNLNVHAKPEKLRLSRDTVGIWIHLWKIKLRRWSCGTLNYISGRRRQQLPWECWYLSAKPRSVTRRQ